MKVCAAVTSIVIEIKTVGTRLSKSKEISCVCVKLLALLPTQLKQTSSESLAHGCDRRPWFTDTEEEPCSASVTVPITGPILSNWNIYVLLHFSRHGLSF